MARLPVRPGRRHAAPARHCRSPAWGSMTGPSMEAVLAGAIGFLRLVRSGPAGSRCALGPQRPGRRKQESLAEPHVVVEQIDHRALALDPLGDQVDAEAAEQVGKVGGVDVGRRGLPLIEQQRRRHLDEADAAVGEFARLDPQVGDVIDREAEAALRQGREMLGLGRAQIAERRLLEFEHEGRRQRAVGFEEIEALREGRRDCRASPRRRCRTRRRPCCAPSAGAAPARISASPCDRSARSARRLPRPR